MFNELTLPGTAEPVILLTLRMRSLGVMRSDAAGPHS